MTSPHDTDELEEIETDADTEPTPIVKSISMEIKTDVDIIRPMLVEPTFPVDNPTPPLVAEPAVGLAKPSKGKSKSDYANRKFRLPTESEIADAVDAVPTENLPILERMVEESTDHE